MALFLLLLAANTLTNRLRAYKNNMDIKELRIGNWVQCDEDIYIVNGLWHQGVVCLTMKDNDPHNIHPSNLYPVPLTPEILERCGFSKDWREDAGGAPYFVWYRGFDIHQNEEGTEFHFSVYVRWDGTFKGGYHIKSLHQLQNLYFVLTGQELTLNTK